MSKTLVRPWFLSLIAISAGAAPPRDAAAQSVRTDCVNATVVGLRWDVPAGAPRSALYEVRRDGVLLETTRATELVDTGVTPATAYSYSVAMVSAKRGSGAPPAAQALRVSTPAAPAEGDAPYCPSRVIRSIEFNWNGYTEPNGSDIWPATWGRDGKVYTFFGDGGGFGGDNDRGRTSFGVASLAGTAPFDPGAPNAVVPPARHNIYGGFEGEHTSTLSGKAGSIVAVGRDFYGRGGIWNAAELRTEPAPWSSPERVQIVYSRGNAYSWAVAGWAFCSEEDRGRVGDGARFCPGSFVNFGRGNAGAPDGRVYVTGVSLATWLGWNRPTQVEERAETFLARVKKRSVLDASAYEYFAGLDARQEPIWVRDPARMRPIFTDRTQRRPDCRGVCPPMREFLGDIVYDPAIRRYIGVAQAGYIGQTSFYDAPRPWGPWTVLAYNNVDPASGSGGWANLGTQGGASLGVHIVNAWTSADGLTLWMTYSSDGKAPRGALFPPEGTALDSFNLVSAGLTLRTRTDRAP